MTPPVRPQMGAVAKLRPIRPESLGGVMPELVATAPAPTQLRPDQLFQLEMMRRLAPMSRAGEAVAEPFVEGVLAGVENGLAPFDPLLSRVGLGRSHEIVNRVRGPMLPVTPLGQGVRRLIRMFGIT